MTSRDDIGRANLFRGRSHLEKFRDAVSFRFSLSFSRFYLSSTNYRVYIYYDQLVRLYNLYASSVKEREKSYVRQDFSK